MKITGIRIEGFHKVQNTYYDLTNINYLHGVNGAGKSTVLQAIQLALLGYLPDTPKNSKEAIFRHSNGRAMSVTLDIDDNGNHVQIFRTWAKYNSTIDAKVDIRPEGYDITQLVKEVELPIFNFTEFLNLSANKLKDWFIQFLPDRGDAVNWRNVLKEAAAVLPPLPENTRTVDSIIDEFLGDSGVSTKSGTSEIRAANDYFKLMIKVTKEIINRHIHTSQELVHYDDIDASLDVAAIRQRLADLQKFKADAIRAQEAVKRNTALFDRLKEMESSGAIQAKCAEDDERYLAADARSNELSAKISELNEQRVSTEHIATDRTVIATLQAEINAAQKVIDGDGICPYTETKCDSIVRYIAELQKQVDIGKAKIIEINERIAQTTSKNAEIDAQIHTMHGEISRCEAELNSIYNTYKDYNNFVAQLQEIVYDGSDLDKIESEIAEQTELLAKVSANQKYQELSSKILSDRMYSESLLEYYKCWEKLTGINGMQSGESAASPFVDFSESITEILKHVFDDATAEFNISTKANSFSFGINRGGRYIPYDLLSSGEKCMYALSLMICIVRQSKCPLKLILVDDLFDHLDPANMTKLFDCLKSIEDVQFVFAGVQAGPEDITIEIGG